MKRQMLKKLLTTTLSLAVCGLLPGNTITPPLPGNNDDSPILEIIVPEDDSEETGISPLDDADQAENFDH